MPHPPDPILSPLLRAQSEKQTALEIERILREHAAPRVALIIRQRTGVSPVRRAAWFRSQQTQDAEDIYQEAMTGIAERLKCDSASLSQITDFGGYVAVCAYRAFYAHLRRKYPARAHVKEAVRNTLKREPALAAWKILTAWVGGLAQWARQGEMPTRSPRLDRLCADPEAWEPQTADVSNPRVMQMRELLTALFTHLQHPVELDTLTTLAAAQMGLRDLEVAENAGAESEEHPAAQMPDEGGDVPTLAARSAFFARLWEQIRALPSHQCAALLLNFKDEGGRLTTIFTDTQTATRRQMAEAMRLPLTTLEAVWDDLPLDDNAIADLLGVTRQQVINARASALQRLRTREKGIRALD